MAAYTKEFLISAYLSRFAECSLISVEQLLALEKQAVEFYDKVGRDTFRVYASLDADAIKKAKSTGLCSL